MTFELNATVVNEHFTNITTSSCSVPISTIFMNSSGIKMTNHQFYRASVLCLELVMVLTMFSGS